MQADKQSSAHQRCKCVDTAGEVVRRRHLPNIEVRETVYRAGLVLEPHSHPHAYLNYVLEGTYEESYGDEPVVVGPGALRFLPAGLVHSNAYQDGARCLLVRLEPAVLENVNEHAGILDEPADLTGPKPELLSRRLYHEFRQKDSAASLAIEGIVLEIMAEKMRAGAGPSRQAPRWLQRAKESIHTRFLEVPSLTEIAKDSGVHPVHLSREFRRYYDCTVGEYMRKLRIEHASHLLANTPTPLVEIAAVCGFADQSHFSATFKKVAGITPARFRELHQ